MTRFMEHETFNSHKDVFPFNFIGDINYNFLFPFPLRDGESRIFEGICPYAPSLAPLLHIYNTQIFIILSLQCSGRASAQNLGSSGFLSTRGRVLPKTLNMVLTASQCDAPHIMSLSQVNNASVYAVGLRLTMLQIYLYKYQTVAKTQKKKRSAPRPCVDLIINYHYTYLFIYQFLSYFSCLANCISDLSRFPKDI